MADRQFSKVQKQLDETLLKLKETKEPELRQALLKKMRVLLADAQGILDSHD
jgi:hypothetical protein